MKAHDGIGAGALWLTYVGLCLLLVLAVLVPHLSLGRWSTAAALAVATGKALLIAAVFMQLRRGKALTLLYAAAGIYWAVVLFALTLADYATRH